MLLRYGIDPHMTQAILDRINRGEGARAAAGPVEIPSPDDRRIVDISRLHSWGCDADRVAQAIHRYDIPQSLIDRAELIQNRYLFDRATLRLIGIYLLPFVSFGILNGGSATSYVDRKKNHGFDETVFDLYAEHFAPLSIRMKSQPKGLTPGFFGEDFTPGPTFIELKMRALLLAAKRRERLFGRDERTLYPMFQMTNAQNDSTVAGAYSQYRVSAGIAPLVKETGIEITNVATGIQPLIAAFTHSEEGEQRSLFMSAHGKVEPLPLPGGHGQCFAALKTVFEGLAESGKEFIQIGNVDNLGNTVDEVSVAILALSGSPAGFDFARRTPVDVKGGILVQTKTGKLTCADIGPALSFDSVLQAEAEKKSVLFNCATGLFNLTQLMNSLDRILNELPIRLSDQDKDAGKYSQAEQITWEVIGLLDDPIIFSVNKYDRFLAAKLLVENLLTSGVALDSLTLVQGNDATRRIRSVAMQLNEGLVRKLVSTYGLAHTKTGWQPNT